ncbi:MAG: hypothetical protein AAGF73_12080 [Actinomycetota bacterium]
MNVRSSWVVPAVLLIGVAFFAVIAIRGGGDDPTRESVTASGPEFSSIGEMAAASDVIVEGTIVAADDGRRITDPADPESGVVTRLYELQVAEVYQGDAGDFVLVEQEDALLDGTPIVVNGMLPHEIGDVGFWFLVVGDSEEFPFTAVVNQQGRLLIGPDDRIDGALLSEPTPAAELRTVLRGG